jgi:hypothetical protein
MGARVTSLTLAQLLAHRKAIVELVSAHYPIPRRLIDAHAGRLDFARLSQNPHLAWDEELLAAHPRRWDWRELANNPALPWSVALVKKHVPRNWSWENLMWQERVFADPALLALCLPHWSKKARRYLEPLDERGAGG